MRDIEQSSSKSRRWLTSILLLVAMAALPLLFLSRNSPGNAPDLHLGTGLGSGLLRTRYQFSSYEEYVALQMKKTSNPRLRKLWTSRDWRRKVDVFSGIFARLIRSELLAPGSKALCIGARVGQEVVALKENGVQDSVGIDLIPAPPLVIKGDIHSHPFPNNTFDFEFSNVFDHALYPARFVSEIERTLKPGGIAVLHLILKHRGDKYSANDLLSLDPLLLLFRNSEILSVQDVDAFGLDTELIIRKKVNHPEMSPRCSPKVSRETMGRAEPLILEEPRKPWITLKRNVANIRYLPELLTRPISTGRTGHVYIDVGARNYGSSIGSWFHKAYPKQGVNFSVFAIEADPAFHRDYERRKKKVSLIPYAAWVRNETLRFFTKDGGMGRIVNSRGSGEAGADEEGEVREVEGFDFAEWLGRSVRASDYVVMKMDVEGAEFELLPRLVESGGICLVDEVFLECHYNRWQKCCPNRTDKYRHTYEQCLDLFRTLRSSGVLVHQWW